MKSALIEHQMRVDVAIAVNEILGVCAWLVLLFLAFGPLLWAAFQGAVSGFARKHSGREQKAWNHTEVVCLC
jgi:hypothetical protein